jgi:branched-subunit amino acid transport protein AzlD
MIPIAVVFAVKDTYARAPTFPYVCFPSSQSSFYYTYLLPLQLVSAVICTLLIWTCYSLAKHIKVSMCIHEMLNFLIVYYCLSLQLQYGTTVILVTYMTLACLSLVFFSCFSPHSACLSDCLGLSVCLSVYKGMLSCMHTCLSLYPPVNRSICTISYILYNYTFSSRGGLYVL